MTNNIDWWSNLKVDVYPGKGFFHAIRDVIERQEIFQATQMWMMLESNNPQRKALLEICRALALKGANEALKELVNKVLEEANRGGYQYQVEGSSDSGQGVLAHEVQDGC